MQKGGSAVIEKTETETEKGRSVSSKKEMICAVVAISESGGHGEWQAVLQVTKNPQEAVDTARDAEKLGYQFYSDETGICVYCLEVGKQYQVTEFNFSGTGLLSVNYPVIFRRYKMNGEWREEWFNEMTKFIMGLH